MPGTPLLLPGVAAEHQRDLPDDAGCPSCLPTSSCSQPPFPSLRRVLYGDGIPFAHPAEREFARLLTYYRVRWVYEPTTFTLRTAEDGRAVESFTPDFFLPDQKLYVELTTMRQPLVTRKNRKLRRLHELYPGVNIRLMYRRDVLRLEAAYRTAADSRPPVRLGEALWTEADIEARIGELADAVAADVAGPRQSSAPLLLAVGAGADGFQRRLAAALRRTGVACDCDRLDPSRYRPDGAQVHARALRRPLIPVSGRRVLVLSDVVSTGLSLTWTLNQLARHQPAEMRACALFDRRSARLLDPGLAWTGFAAPDAPLAGLGLALHRRFRDRPFVGIIELNHDA